MAQIQHLQRRGGVFRFRARISCDLIPIIGRSEVSRSLGTCEPSEAKRRLALAWAEWEGLKDRIRAGDMTRSEINALVDDFVFSEHQQAQALHIASKYAPKLENRVKLEEIQRERMRVLLEDDLAKGRIFHSEQHLRDFAETRGVTPTDEMLKALAIGWFTMLSGQQTPTVAPPVASTSPAPEHQQPVTPTEPRQKAVRVRPLGELVEPHLRERSRAGIGQSWLGEIRTALSWLTGWFGDDYPIDKISPDDMRDLKEALLELPAGWSKKAQYKSMHMRDIAEHNRTADLPRLDVAALIGKRWRPMTDFLGWAHRNGYAPANPAEDITIMVSRATKKAKKRDMFEVADLQRIFTQPIYTGMASSAKWYEPGTVINRDARFWIPLLAVFTGGRRGELCQLRTDDIVMRDDTMCIFIRERFTDDGEKIASVKNQDSVRLVPVHPELHKIGFGQYVEKRKAEGHEHLFDVSPDRNFDAFGKWFSRLLTYADVKTGRNCFHSFRHCMEQAMRENIEDFTSRSRITGRTNNHSSEIYGKGHTVATLAREIAKVQYPGLDLSHLHV